MKKLLGIMVLGLILTACNPSTQQVVYSGQQSGKIKVGATKYEVRTAFLSGWNIDNDPWSGGCSLKYYKDTQMEIISATRSQDAFFVFENVTNLQQKIPQGTYCSSSESNMGNGTLKAWVSTLDEAVQIATGKVDMKNQATQQSIEPYKVMCKNIGYQEGTEKFADCVKDMYLKNFDTQNQSITNMTGVPKKKIDPSVWDDIISLSTGTMSSKSKTPRKVCFKTGEEKIGFGKSCRYSCTGSLYTMMVGSMEMCPLTVDR